MTNPYSPSRAVRHTLLLTGLIALLGLAGCATPPAASTLARLPMVNFGDPAPQGDDYILHFPAGKPIPTSVAISGNLFTKPAHETLTVTLNRDIYVYKDWISYDNQHWQQGRKAMAVKADIRLPGPKHPEPGYIRLQLDALSDK